MMRIGHKKLFVPETLQSSFMDCGPAALKSLLAGFDVFVSYGALRNSCDTSLDGTSIDTLEDVAIASGLDAEQIVIPEEYVLLKQANALPAILVIEHNGLAHFVVVWAYEFGRVQIMDPAVGRRWLGANELRRLMHIHTMTVSSAEWYAWASSGEALSCLQAFLQQLGVTSDTAAQLITRALQHNEWHSLAGLHAIARMIQSMLRRGGVSKGRQTNLLLLALFDRLTASEYERTTIVPADYWPAIEVQPRSDSQPAVVTMRGAVLVRVKSRCSRADTATSHSFSDTPGSPSLLSGTPTANEEQIRPIAALIKQMRLNGLLAAISLIPVIVIAAGAVLLESLLFRSLLDLTQAFAILEQRLTLIGFVIGLLAFSLMVDIIIAKESFRLGRQLETRMRLELWRKLPLLRHQFFRSRLISDMADRCHSLFWLRRLPDVMIEWFRGCCELMFTAAAIVWLKPTAALPTSIIVAFALVSAYVAQIVLNERELRTRVQNAALSKLYLDALRGLISIRAHSAELSVRRTHEQLLIAWSRAGLGLARAIVAVDAVQYTVMLGLMAWLVIGSINWNTPSSNASLLLLIYWTLNLGAVGERIALYSRQYPAYRNIAMRVLEPLSEPEEQRQARRSPIAAEVGNSAACRIQRGVNIAMEQVSVRSCGRTILDELSLNIPSGTHVAIVGASGAGKSTLVRLLLGFGDLTAGRILVDCCPFDADQVQRVRGMSAWVDPAIQLWNRSLLDNLLYGSSADDRIPLSQLIASADLATLLDTLDDGLQTQLGDSGSLVSGGESQRIRFGRAMMRSRARLAILDEPFSGLDRKRRLRLAHNARRLWQEATLLYVTHDIQEASAFDRVIVMAQGRVVEYDNYDTLASQDTSQLRALLDAETRAKQLMRTGHSWHRLELEQGRVTIRDPHPPTFPS